MLCAFSLSPESIPAALGFGVRPSPGAAMYVRPNAFRKLRSAENKRKAATPLGLVLLGRLTARHVAQSESGDMSPHSKGQCRATN